MYEDPNDFQVLCYVKVQDTNRYQTPDSQSGRVKMQMQIFKADFKMQTFEMQTFKMQTLKADLQSKNKSQR